MTHVMKHVHRVCLAADPDLKLYYIAIGPNPTDTATLYEFVGSELRLCETQAEKVFPAFTVAVSGARLTNPSAGDWDVQIGYYEPLPKSTDNIAPVLSRAHDLLTAVLVGFWERPVKARAGARLSASFRVGGAHLYGMQMQVELPVTFTPSRCS